MAANDKEVLVKADHVTKFILKARRGDRQSKPLMMYPLRS